MITPIVLALAGGMACSEGPTPCAYVIEARARQHRIVRRRSSCAGLLPIEKLYSVGIEGGLVCIPLRSLVAGGGGA